MVLSSCTENVPAVHQPLVYQKLFVRWTQSTLNRLFLSSRTALAPARPGFGGNLLSGTPLNPAVREHGAIALLELRASMKRPCRWNTLVSFLNHQPRISDRMRPTRAQRCARARRNLCQTHRIFQKQPRRKIREEPRLRVRPAQRIRMGETQSAARARTGKFF